MKEIFDNKCMVTCTNNDKVVEAEVDNFTESKGFDAFVANNKIPMRWNGRIFVGNAHGMEFTSPGPKVYKYNRRNF